MALGIVPTFVRGESDLETTIKTLETLRVHEPELETLVVDDKSPAEHLVDELENACDRLSIRMHRCETNAGFSSSVNVGLREALTRGIDAILINADIEFLHPFVEIFENTTDSTGNPAAVVGALLMFPNGLIQHGGVYMDLYARGFDHKFRFGPASLPEAHVPAVSIVTGALQYIRRSTMETIGVYDDEQFRMSWEDVDYCLRVFEVGLECVYQPAVRAIHHESLFRSQTNEKIDGWQIESLRALKSKHGSTPLGRFVPPLK